MFRLCLALALVLFGASPCLALPSFPGCKGWGCSTMGGAGAVRGTPSKVCVVNSLADVNTDSGSHLGNGVYQGTLKYCRDIASSAAGGKYILMGVSGILQYKEQTEFGSYTTVAGQTAPYPGVVLYQTTLDPDWEAEHIIFMHLPVWAGSVAGLPDHTNRKACTTGRLVKNIVFANVDCLWGTDQVFSIGRGTENLTVQRSIIAEGLHCSGVHYEGGCHSMGLLMGGSSDTPRAEKVSFVDNYMAHNNDRNIRYYQSTAEIAGNVVYNWGSGTGNTSNDASAGSTLTIDFLNNNYIEGPSGGATTYALKVESTPPTGSKYYVSGNRCPDDPLGENNPYECVSWGPSSTSWRSSTRVARPTGDGAHTPLTALEAYNQVIAGQVGAYPYYVKSGALAPNTRLFNDVKNLTGTIKDCVFGCTKKAEVALPTRSTNSAIIELMADRDVVTDTGYTKIENWLHGLANYVTSGEPDAPDVPIEIWKRTPKIFFNARNRIPMGQVIRH